MAIGFDASQDCSRVAAAAVAAGVEFVCRYFKNLSLAEARALSDAGLKIVSIFETTAQRALGGTPAGATDGARALDYALQLGQPTGSAIWATADFDPTISQEADVGAYLGAFAGAIGPQFVLGVYANGAICQAVLDSSVGGVSPFTWLAGGMGMRGSRVFADSGRATIIQDVGDKRGLNLGIAIDSDTAFVEEYGGWSLPPAAVETIVIPSALQLQRALNANGAILHVVEDGIWGPRSAAALDAYYRR